MSSNHKDKNVELSDDVKEAAEEIIDATLENLEEEYRGELEPFELYSKRVRLHFLKQMHAYADRFVKGHSAIMNEIENNEEE